MTLNTSARARLAAMRVVSLLMCAVLIAFSASTAIKDQGPCRAILRPGRDRRAQWREAGGQAVGRDGFPREDTCHGVS